MMIQPRTIVAAAATLALVGGAVWCAALLFDAPRRYARGASVEVAQLQEPAWTVEIKDLGTDAAVQPASRAAEH